MDCGSDSPPRSGIALGILMDCSGRANHVGCFFGGAKFFGGLDNDSSFFRLWWSSAVTLKHENHPANAPKMKLHLNITIGAIMISSFGQLTQAAVSITNGNMESNTLINDGDLQTTLPTGWVGNTTGTRATIGENRSSMNTDQSGIAWMQLQSTGAAAGTSIGDIASNLDAFINVNYVLTRRLNETTSINHTVYLYAGSASTWVGGTLLDSEIVTGNLANLTKGNAGSYFNGALTLNTPASVAGGQTNLWLVFENGITSPGNAQLLVDNVSVAVVPEASTLALGGIGLLASLRRKRRS